MSNKLISVMIDEKLYERVKKHCFDKGDKIKNFIAYALDQALTRGE